MIDGLIFKSVQTPEWEVELDMAYAEQNALKAFVRMHKTIWEVHHKTQPRDGMRAEVVNSRVFISLMNRPDIQNILNMRDHEIEELRKKEGV